MSRTNLILPFFIFIMIIVIVTMHQATNCAMDIATYSYKTFYNTIREDQLNVFI